MNFVCTPLHEVWERGKKRAEEHWNDVEQRESFPDYLDIDWDYYLSASIQGLCHVVSAWDGKDIIAYLIFVISDEPLHTGTKTAAVQVFWVDKKHKGLGTKMLKKSIECMKEMGADRITNEVEGERLGRFMEKLGFAPVRTVYQMELSK